MLDLLKRRPSLGIWSKTGIEVSVHRSTVSKMSGTREGRLESKRPRNDDAGIFSDAHYRDMGRVL